MENNMINAKNKLIKICQNEGNSTISHAVTEYITTVEKHINELETNNTVMSMVIREMRRDINTHVDIIKLYVTDLERKANNKII
jgi:bacterioferritin (cytochrome b1)